MNAKICIFSEQANIVAQSVSPDNTSDITTTVESNSVLNIIHRDSIGSLRSTVDDLITNINVAVEVVNQTKNYIELNTASNKKQNTNI
jgi:tRNA threonylcarbamoyladenosine modification (KEOPS) complex  Pcc1 subunit